MQKLIVSLINVLLFIHCYLLSIGTKLGYRLSRILIIFHNFIVATKVIWVIIAVRSLFNYLMVTTQIIANLLVNYTLNLLLLIAFTFNYMHLFIREVIIYEILRIINLAFIN